MEKTSKPAEKATTIASVESNPITGEPKIPLLVRIIALLMLLGGGLLLVASGLVIYRLSGQADMGLLSTTAGIMTVITFVAGLFLVILAFGVRKLKPWALWILTGLVTLEVISYAVAYYLSISKLSIGLNYSILFFNITISLLVLFYVWLSYIYVHKRLNKVINAFREILGIIIAIIFVIAPIAITFSLAISKQNVFSSLLKNIGTNEALDLKENSTALKQNIVDTPVQPSQNVGSMATQSELEVLIKKISAFMTLPTDETPSLATVTDLNSLKDQPFFANAQNGDQVLIYTKAKKAILYRPSTNKVIEVMPISFNK